jgi:hypothetical protein
MKTMSKIITTIFAATLLVSCGNSFAMHKKDTTKKDPWHFLSTLALPQNVEKHRHDRRQTQQKMGDIGSEMVASADKNLYKTCLQLTTDDFSIEKSLQTMYENLFKFGADPNFHDKNHDNRAPLHQAIAKKEAAPAVKLLLEWKANPHGLSDAGNTPLHMALYCRNDVATDLLLHARAHLTDIKNKDLLSAIECLHHDDADSALTILKHNDQLDSAVYKLNEAQIQKLSATMMRALNHNDAAAEEYYQKHGAIQKSVNNHLQQIGKLPHGVSDIVISYSLPSMKDWHEATHSQHKKNH